MKIFLITILFFSLSFTQTSDDDYVDNFAPGYRHDWYSGNIYI
jgi:hypothetical protein